MTELFLIGIGAGNPDHLTREAEKAIQEADLILIPDKGENKADLAEIRETICRRVRGQDAKSGMVSFDLPVRVRDEDYLQSVDDWHDKIALAWSEAMMRGRTAPKRVALLVWGDPSLYDSSLRIAARLRPKLKIRVIPGITALQALTAAHAIPLNDIGEPVLITTGRKLRDQGWPDDADSIAVMLDGECSFKTLPSKGAYIWWGAFLGMANEILLQGPLSTITPEIIRARADARARHGWIMDIYLLHRHRHVSNNEEID